MLLSIMMTCLPSVAAGQASEATPTPLSAIEAELADCPMSTGNAIPESEEYFTPWGVGASPFWLLGFSNPPESLRDEFPVTDDGLRYVGPAFVDTNDGWGMKALWVLQGGWTSPVAIRGERIGGGIPLTFNVNYGEPPVETLHLNPAEPGIPVQHGDWREWPSSLYAQTSGCYELSATWDGGGWSVKIPFLLPPDAQQLGIPTPRWATPTASPEA
jgi:hypothetical protein